MKKIFTLLIIFLPVTLLLIENSCTPEQSCQNQDTIDGIIDTTYDLGMCYQYMSDTSYVITDIVEFQSLRSKMDSFFLSKNSGCDTASLVAPNFEKQTLLGCFAQGTGCDASFHRTVLQDDTQHKYTYTIEVEDCGKCTYKIPSMNWVLVPKLPQNYTVEFKIVHKTVVNTVEKN